MVVKKQDPCSHRHREFHQRDWACVHFSKCLVTHTNVHTHTHTHTHTRTHTYNLYTHICIHTYTYKNIHIYYTHVCTHTHTHTHSNPPSILSEPQRKPHTHQVTKSTCLVLKPQFVTRVRQVLRGLFRWGLCPGDHLQTPICFPKPLSHCRVRGVWCVGMG